MYKMCTVLWRCGLDSGMAGILVVGFMLLKFVISLIFHNSFVVSDYVELT